MIPEGATIRNILVMRPRYVGDVLLTVPVLRRLRNEFPSAHICFMADPAVRDLIGQCPYIDSVIVFDRKGGQQGLRGRWGFVAALKKHKFDLAVVLLRSLSSALYAFLAGIPLRVGFDTERRGLLLTHRVPYDRDGYEADCFQSVIDVLGIERGDSSLEVWLREEDERYAESWLQDKGLGDTRDILFINPGPAGTPKSFDSRKFAGLADRVSREFGAAVVVTWGPEEKPVAEEIIEFMECGGLVAPPTDLLQLAALLQRGRVMVTTDTGPLHLASAVGLATVALFGPTDPGKWNPRAATSVFVKEPIACWPCNFHHCKRGYDCMKMIEVDTIYGEVTRLWKSVDKEQGL